MKNKTLLISGIAAASLLVGGLAFAQSGGYRHDGTGPQSKQGLNQDQNEGQGHGRGGKGHGGQMGQGKHGQEGHGMRGQMGQGMRGEMGRGQRGGPGFTQFDPARIDTLKTEFAITAAQEPAWTKYAKAVQDTAASIKTTRENIDRDAMQKLSEQDRAAFRTQMQEQRQREFASVQTAAKELLATLDDTQKAKAQDTLPGLAVGPGTNRSAGMNSPRHQH